MDDSMSTVIIVTISSLSVVGLAAIVYIAWICVKYRGRRRTDSDVLIETDNYRVSLV